MNYSASSISSNKDAAVHIKESEVVLVSPDTEASLPNSRVV
jgi:hypothetical protein